MSTREKMYNYICLVENEKEAEERKKMNPSNSRLSFKQKNIIYFTCLVEYHDATSRRGRCYSAMKQHATPK